MAAAVKQGRLWPAELPEADKQAGRAYTTAELLRTEREILAMVRTGRNTL